MDKCDRRINALCCYLKNNNKLSSEELFSECKIHTLPFQSLVGVCGDHRKSRTLHCSPGLQERLPHQLHAPRRIRKFLILKIYIGKQDVGSNVEFLCSKITEKYTNVSN